MGRFTVQFCKSWSDIRNEEGSFTKFFEIPSLKIDGLCIQDEDARNDGLCGSKELAELTLCLRKRAFGYASSILFLLSSPTPKSDM